MSNAPPFDPLNPTPEQDDDMLLGYLAAKDGVKPLDASMAFEHGWRMRRNDMAHVVDDDQRECARRALGRTEGAHERVAINRRPG